eukprot:TRINITY_DN15839_c0_g1_i2.p1 TRINITY_DN15839_c0_g1~~TRINITY_DN15839_c0_g1_i2.p1  ORF type:complete len:504 (-),score=25.03 TRINITY_DN15839_c0_g1_i2:420-1931(-)
MAEVGPTDSQPSKLTSTTWIAGPVPLLAFVFTVVCLSVFLFINIRHIGDVVHTTQASASEAVPLSQDSSRSGEVEVESDFDNIPTSPTVFSEPVHCGNWQQEYALLHADILSGRSPPRFAVSIGVEAGLADRLIGVISEFYYALLTRRAFQITPGQGPPFELAWESPYINWTRAKPPEELVGAMNNRFHDKYLQQGYRDSCEWCPGGEPKTVDKTKYGFIYLTNNKTRSDKLFRVADMRKVPDGGVAETVFLASNRGRTYLMFENKHHRRQLDKWGLRQDTAFACAFDFLFRPNAAVRSRVADELAQLSEPDTLKIGVNVRTGDRSFAYDDETFVDAAVPYVHCAEEIEATRRKPGQRVVWYVISDSLKLRQYVKSSLGEKVVTNTETKSIHPMCSELESFGVGSCGHGTAVEGETPRETALRDAAAQLLAFSCTRYQVLTKLSGFGRVGAWLSVLRHRQRLEFYELRGTRGHTQKAVEASIIPCGLNDTTLLEKSSAVWAGI